MELSIGKKKKHGEIWTDDVTSGIKNTTTQGVYAVGSQRVKMKLRNRNLVSTRNQNTPLWDRTERIYRVYYVWGIVNLHLKLSRLHYLAKQTRKSTSHFSQSPLSWASAVSISCLKFVKWKDLFFKLAFSKSCQHLYLFDAITFSLRLTIISKKNCDLFTSVLMKCRYFRPLTSSLILIENRINRKINFLAQIFDLCSYNVGWSI